MSDNTTQASSGGIGIFGVLGVVFIVLKLTGVINWSWWWITAPFWGPMVVLVGGLLIWFAFAFIYEMVKK